MLPLYCQANLRPGKVKAPGTSAYGCTEWFNHFCPALVAANRAMNPVVPRRQRVYYLKLADDHIRYTKGRLAKTCKLAPDVDLAEQRVNMLRSIVK